MNVVGTNTIRSDGAAKVRGEAVYGVDVALPGMLHARLLRSPICGRAASSNSTSLLLANCQEFGRSSRRTTLPIIATGW